MRLFGAPAAPLLRMVCSVFQHGGVGDERWAAAAGPPPCRASAGGLLWLCAPCRYKGPKTIGSGVQAAIKDKFPTITTVVLQDFPK